jgi:glycosyltransferase involved in cell wall biosynthesis
MKIATLVRGILPAPRPADVMYSPLEVAVEISENLTKRGHYVAYYGPNGTHLDVSEVVTRGLRPLVQSNSDLQRILNSPDFFVNYLPSLYDHYLIEDMFKRARKGDFDLLHFHHPESVLPFTRLFPDIPVAITLHDQLDPLRREIMEMYKTPNQHYISISNNQRRLAPDLPYAATVYNGVDMELFKPDGPHEDYLLYDGRIVPDKGVKEAVQLALQTKSRLLIIGQTLPSDQWYFDAHIKPYLSDKILYLGYIEHSQTVKYFQKARALIMAVQWEEPFGLTMVEAMACGTPVIGMRRGSIPEIVVDGKTGFVVDSLSEMAEALKKIGTIKSQACREHAVTHFSMKRMIDGYEHTFKQIASQRKKRGGLAGIVKQAAKPLVKPVKKIRRSSTKK